MVDVADVSKWTQELLGTREGRQEADCPQLFRKNSLRITVILHTDLKYLHLILTKTEG